MKVCETLNVFAGLRPDGSTVLEEVVVEALESGRYRLEQSPGLVLGLAAGDVFELTEERKAVVLERGGNLCIQVFPPSDDAPDLEAALTDRMRPLGGRRDGRARSLLVYTVPVTVGFKAVEAVLEAVITDFPGVEWVYGNVYDNDDGLTPLNWWVPG